jgi:hypothetical protein
MWKKTAAERITLISGLKRRSAFDARQRALMRRDATGRTDSGASMYAECVTCGAKVPDWRGLLGVGAEIVVCRGAGDRRLLTYPFACSECGGSEIEITSMRAGASHESLAATHPVP